MLYNLLKNLITNNYFATEDMKNKLNIFVLYNQITEEQYAELMSLVAPPISNTSTTETASVSPSDTVNTAQSDENSTTSSTITQ